MPNLTTEAATDGNAARLLRLCEELDVEHFVMRIGASGSVKIGLAAAGRYRLLEALMAEGKDEPIYIDAQTSKHRHRGLVKALDCPLTASTARLHVWRQAHDPVAGRLFGAGQASVVEFWEEQYGGGLAAPSMNRRTSFLTNRDREKIDFLETPAGPGRSLAAFTKPTGFEVKFPIDVVYLWVDDTDPAWRAKRDATARSEPVSLATEGAITVRFRDQDELRYSLRSLTSYAPWVRHIYLVTDQQRPDWLVEHKRLTVVDHREIFPAHVLPTFNSHAITSRVHHIEGLSEHFLLFNDDVLLGRRVSPESFFHGNGLPKLFMSRTPIPSGDASDDDRPHIAARKRVRALIEKEYGFAPAQALKHAPMPFRRSKLAELEERFACYYAETLASPFRARTDIVTGLLHHYSSYAEMQAVPGAIVYDYFNLGWRRSFHRAASLIAQRSVDCYCLNDDDDGDLTLDDRVSLLRALLDVLLPDPSPFEANTARPERAEQLDVLRSANILR